MKEQLRSVLPVIHQIKQQVPQNFTWHSVQRLQTALRTYTETIGGLPNELADVKTLAAQVSESVKPDILIAADKSTLWRKARNHFINARNAFCTNIEEMLQL